MKKSQLTSLTYLNHDPEFKKFGRNGFAIFGLSLFLGIDDIDDFYSNSWTEDEEDKKIDLFYIDLNEARAAIAQVYISERFGKSSAPSNKASDLNTACSWIFSANESNIPKRIRPKAIELRNSIINQEIERIDFLYAHNCNESINVETELRTVTDGARDKIIALTGKKPLDIQLSYRELGITTVENLFKARDKDILVEDILTLPKGDYIEEKGDKWNAVQFTVSGDWIRQLYLKYRDYLFSANYRDYMGSYKRKGNINYQITKTAEKEPPNFWVYNNGITALTNKISIKKKIEMHGLSIINGAQTTGALGETSEENAKLSKVSFRVVECKNKDRVNNIIKFNNTQNEIKAFDKRSGDHIQKRLSTEFHEKYSVTYLHRRTQTRAPKNAITAVSIAPLLCAFHGDPNTAHRQAKDIFLQDNIYNRVFNDSLSPEHVFLLKCLSIAIDKFKEYLNERIKKDEATDLDKEELDLLKYSASRTFIFYIIGQLAELILNKKVTNLYNWKAKSTHISQKPSAVTSGWVDVLETIFPQIIFVIKKEKKEESSNPFYEVPRSFEQSKKVADELKANLGSLLPTLGRQLDNIRKRTSL